MPSLPCSNSTRLFWRCMNPKVEDLTPYAISVATGFARRRGANDPDAYVSEALLALLEEGRKWDPERGMSLKSFVRQRIVWALLRFHKRERERLELFDPQVDTEELYVADRATDERWHEEQMAKLLDVMQTHGRGGRGGCLRLAVPVLPPLRRPPPLLPPALLASYVPHASRALPLRPPPVSPMTPALARARA